MAKNESVVFMKDYGSVRIKLKEQLEAKNMTRNYLARAIQTRFEVVNKWYLNKVEKIDTDILARMCFVLNCKVEDIIEYKE